MPEEIDLETYCEEIEALIIEGKSEEAITAARHILSFYPKFVEAYRLLGKACLEKGDLVSAADMFMRVLGADPEDLIAYVGLADVYKTQGKIEQAIWYLERALDLAPGHKELRKELENLYREAGVSELLPHYTLAGLGRIYLKNGLLEQADQALTEALEKEPGRVDVQVTLAEVQWRLGKRLESAQTCLEVLDTLPYCLKANLILGYLWSSVNPSEAKIRFEIAQTLDPLNHKAWELFGKESPLQPRRIKIPKFEIAPTPVEVKGEMPAWLESLELEELPPLPEEVGKPEEVEVEEIPKEAEGLPPWLKGEEIAIGETLEELPPWLKGEEKAPEEAPVEVPPLFEEEVAEELPSEELPPWLRGEEVLPEEALAEEKAPEEAPAEVPPLFEEEITEELPPWLRGEEIVPEEALAEERFPEEAPVELPPWLEEEVVEEMPPEELPPWLRGEEVFPEEALAEEKPPEEVPVEGPPWLEKEKEAVEEVPPEELLPWLKGEEEVPIPPVLEEIAEVPEEVTLEEMPAEIPPSPEKEVTPTPEVVPPSWIESLRPLAETFLEEEIESALAAEAEMAAEEMKEVEQPPAPPPKPKKADELLEAAKRYAQEGAWEEAIRYYRKLLPHKKYWEEVCQDLEAALEKGVVFPGIYELLGDIYREKGLLDQALEFYRKALSS